MESKHTLADCQVETGYTTHATTYIVIDDMVLNSFNNVSVILMLEKSIYMRILKAYSSASRSSSSSSPLSSFSTTRSSSFSSFSTSSSYFLDDFRFEDFTGVVVSSSTSILDVSSSEAAAQHSKRMEKIEYGSAQDNFLLTRRHLVS